MSGKKNWMNGNIYILNEIETKFWENHEKTKANLESKGLLEFI